MTETSGQLSTTLPSCFPSIRYVGQIIPLANCMQITYKALRRDNSCTNIELKYRGSFFQELCFEAIFYWPFYFCMWEMQNLAFMYLQNLQILALFLDSGIRFLVCGSAFRFSDSWRYCCPFLKKAAETIRTIVAQFPWSQYKQRSLEGLSTINYTPT